MSTAPAGYDVSDRAPSVGAMFVSQVAKGSQREAFRHRNAQLGWESMTWGQTKDVVFELAAGLLSLGLQPEERVAIASQTRIEWILADLAVMCAGGATTTIYPTSTAPVIDYIIADSDSKVLVVEDAEQLAKVVGHTGSSVTIVLIEGSSDDERVITWEQLRERGRAHLAENPDSVEEAIAATNPDSLATLIYTSGTTGQPKGVRLTHDCWSYVGHAVVGIDLVRPDDLQFLWLPLSHVFGKTLIAIQLEIGFASAVDGVIERIVEGLGEVKPTFMAGAPRIFEKVRARVRLGAAHGVKAKIADWAFAVGERSIEPRLRGEPLKGPLKVQYAIADRLVFSKLKNRLGGRIKFMVSGSNKLNAQVQRWFYAAGLVVIEGYGLTETSAVVAVNDPRTPRLGTVGQALPGTTFRIAEDGEVLVSGPGVAKGYHGLEDQSAESFVDGWLHTGDIGELDADGYLKITDRKKDLIKTSGGKYVAPQKVEGALVAACPYASQVVVSGEGRKYVTALIALDPDSIKAWATSNGEQTDDYAALVTSSKVHDLLQTHVDAANAQLERHETVKRFAVLPAELSVDEGEVTPSMKIRRRAIADKYDDLVASLYDED
ncbi:AMP-dependent synthetase/ligase [Auraticoccus monumenti]|uniref:Acyl-CoA synthetase n=1 Tax=Auraticoccus monumenti TaxID=675864 RepID=A0A1G7EWC1_9ACTN|nr:long-chain fatty acid--CoA ligase [Auraticoccus monumenti]SDE67921.1 long-chain acyl-CoA synthetase [Auraticoccus monumenti]